jgi:predicted amidohydrolase
MKRIKAAAVQIAPDLAGGSGTVDRVCDAIGDAAAQGVELAVFPETFIPYYPYFSFVVPRSSGKSTCGFTIVPWKYLVPLPVNSRKQRHGIAWCS